VYDKPSARFSEAGTLQSCSYPSTIQFRNASTNAVAYKWFFGDGDSSMEHSPTHNYAIAGQFSPMLVAFNANGCSDTMVKAGLVLLGPPVINSITGIPTSGCIPLNVTPKLNIAAPEPIASYSWVFGDGGTSAEATPTHTYTRIGRYDITVTIKTVSGCTTTFTDSNAVVVGKESVPTFTADKTEVCGNEPVQFNGSAVGTVTSWQWSLVDTITKEEDPVIRFKNPGYKTITLSARYNGCVTKITKENFILVKPPFSRKDIIYDCENQLNVTFKDNSEQPLTWLWNFGDGTTSNLKAPPVHSYAAPGSYLVTLTTTNGGCTNVDSSYIAITNEKPVFSYDPADGYICPGGTIIIGVTNPLFVQDYAWSLGDGTQLFSSTSLPYSYQAKGSYRPALTVKYITGCIDSAFSRTPVRVNAPTAAFTASSTVVCAKDTLQFTDNSLSDGVHAIVSRLWDFGDGSTPVINTSPYANLYDKEGIYYAKLTVTDENTCTDTISHPVQVNALPLVSAGADNFVCLGNTIPLAASGAVAYTWQRNSDLSCINCTSPVAAPVASSVYYVTGTGSNGCTAQDQYL
jgi:PKD repeat protein